MKKNLITYLILSLILLFLPITTQAKTLIKKGTVNINPNGYKDIKITTKNKGIIVIQTAVKSTKTVNSGGYRIQLYNANDNRIQNDYDSLKGTEKGSNYCTWWYNDNLFVPSGNYYYHISNSTNSPIKLTYKIHTYPKIATKVKMSKVVAEKGELKRVKLTEYPSGSLIFLKNQKTTNKKIAKFIGGNTPNDMWIKGISAGKTTFTVTLKNNNKKFKTTIEVKNPKPYIKWYSYTLDCGQSFVNKLVYAPGKVTWSSSNTKIATVSKKGKVTTKKPGTCYIYAKCKGKKYKCKVKVDRVWPDFGAYYNNYNTRNNYFSVTIKNWGKKSLLVHSSGAKSIDDDYKSYDRNLRLPSNKNIKIKPGKTKTLKFYVKGRNTWYDWTDHTIMFYVTYAHCKYFTKIWYDGEYASLIKNGKHWYDSYWDENKY